MTGRLPRGVSGKRELATGTLAGILRRVGMTPEEFAALLR